MAWLTQPNDNAHVILSDDEYYQSVGFDRRPSYYLDGVPYGHYLVAMSLRVRDRVEEWRGLTMAAAFAIGGETVEMAGTDSFSFESRSVKVSRRRTNEADGWTVTRTTSWRALYQSGVWQYGAPESAFA